MSENNCEPSEVVRDGTRNGIAEFAPVTGQAETEALEYLETLGSQIQEILFTDTIPLHDGNPEHVIGELSVQIDKSFCNRPLFPPFSTPAAELTSESTSPTPQTQNPCYLVTVRSSAKTSQSQYFKSTLNAYVCPEMLETVSSSQRKLLMTSDGPLEVVTEIARGEGGRYVISETATGKPDVKLCFRREEMRGFISEGADKILQRLLCRPNRPRSVTLLSYANRSIVPTVYRTRTLPEYDMRNGSMAINAIEMDRAIGRIEPSDPSIHWRSVYLAESKSLVYLRNLDSPLVMEVLGSSRQTPRHLQYRNALSERRDETTGNMEFVSEFLESKKQLSKIHEKYIADHPELRDLVADYLQLLLHRKPQDVFEFTTEHFSS